MAGTNAHAAKQRLIDLLDASTSLVGVQVAYSPPREIERECIFAGKVSGPVELAAMRGGARLMRTERLTLRLYVEVAAPGDDVAAAEARAVELGAVVEELVAGNPTLNDLADLKLAQVAGVELDSGVDDESAYARLVYEIEFVSQPR